MHTAQAESQFHRMFKGGQQRVTKVELVDIKMLEHKFNLCKAALAYTQGDVVLAFHGTTKQNIDTVCKENFRIDKVGSATDSVRLSLFFLFFLFLFESSILLLYTGTCAQGWYGAGIFFSELPSTALTYDN